LALSRSFSKVKFTGSRSEEENVGATSSDGFPANYSVIFFPLVPNENVWDNWSRLWYTVSVIVNVKTPKGTQTSTSEDQPLVSPFLVPRETRTSPVQSGSQNNWLSDRNWPWPSLKAGAARPGPPT